MDKPPMCTHVLAFSPLPLTHSLAMEHFNCKTLFSPLSHKPIGTHHYFIGREGKGERERRRQVTEREWGGGGREATHTISCPHIYTHLLSYSLTHRHTPIPTHTHTHPYGNRHSIKFQCMLSFIVSVICLICTFRTSCNSWEWACSDGCFLPRVTCMARVSKGTSS